MHEDGMRCGDLKLTISNMWKLHAVDQAGRLAELLLLSLLSLLYCGLVHIMPGCACVGRPDAGRRLVVVLLGNRGAPQRPADGKWGGLR
jgi:hypothetical protein